MTARAAAAGIGILLLLVLVGVTGILILKGTSPPVLIGLLVGAALGGLNLALESFSMSWALRVKPSWVLGVSLGGFALRLVTVAVLTIVFHGTPQVDATTFALTYVASFLAFVGVQVWVVSRLTRKAAPSPGGAE
jgi:uncharacterized membrane protein